MSSAGAERDSVELKMCPLFPRAVTSTQQRKSCDADLVLEPVYQCLESGNMRVKLNLARTIKNEVILFSKTLHRAQE